MNKDPLSLARAFLSSAREQGVGRTLTAARTLAYDYLFDLRHGLDTFSWVTRESLDALPTESGTSRYQPTPVRPLRRLLHQLDLPRGGVLVDIGCGKGRVLLIAAEFAFREVRGLEYSPALCRTAERNCARYLARHARGVSHQVLEVDARNYRFRYDETVFFLFNPFGPEMLAEVVDNIALSLQQSPRKAWLVYFNPRYREVVRDRSNPAWERDCDVDGSRFAVFAYA